jgi:hypothetical protein
MARKPSKEAAAIDRERLKKLPQRADVWQVDARPMEMAVKVGDELVRPWMVVVASETHDQILAYEIMHRQASDRDVWKNLLRALVKPAKRTPHRPTQVRLRPEDVVRSVRPLLLELGVGIQETPELELIDHVFEELHEQIAGDDQPGILDMPSVTPRMVKSLFDAAAYCYRQAPWKKIGERTIKVECAKFEAGPWYAVTIGEAGVAAGLVLYDSLETLNRIRKGDLSDEESGRLTSALAVIFSEKDDLPEADLEAMEQYRWKVAGPKAYPSIYRKEKGETMRPPVAWEVELLEGCLRAIPEFVKTGKGRRARQQVTTAVALGQLSLTLSWVA